MPRRQLTALNPARYFRGDFVGTTTARPARMTASPSVWSLAEVDPSVTALDEDVSAEVCVIGAGIAGLLVANRLADAGRSVVVLDQAGVLAGESRQTTAHLTSVPDAGYSRLESMHGEGKTRRFAESHAAAIDLIEKLATAEAIDCDFRRVDGYLYDHADSRAEGSLESESQAGQRAGIECRLVEASPLPFANGPAVRIRHQADFHPVKFGFGLARGIVARGGRIHAPARVAALEKDSGIRVRTLEGPVVRAKEVVVTTNTPINDVVTMHTKQAPYRTYALAAPIPTGWLIPGLYWDRENPYHYVRTAPPREGSLAEGYEWLIVGGEDHKVGQEVHPELRWTRLEQWLRERFERAGAPLHRWSGQVLEPVDGIAFIGRNPGEEHVFIATGHSGNGMTYGAIAALLITDLISGRDNTWASVYDPSRKPVAPRALGTFVRENLNVARHYTEWLSGGDAKHLEQIGRGEGAVIRRGLRKIAVYVDEQGRAHERSAKCPHLGCVVAWNRAEKSWDCPCHGSRFDAYGRLLVGPAVRDLDPADRSVDERAHIPPR
jgi:glycine/D-amino acid oxidase-like deaminating enzyme/nitrite reductase/ring-hydroxylating ferredoxin subunit